MRARRFLLKDEDEKTLKGKHTNLQFNEPFGNEREGLSIRDCGIVEAWSVKKDNTPSCRRISGDERSKTR